MSECDVCIGGNDYDGPEFWDCKTVTARKDYTCRECKRPIPKGTNHERVVGKWEGDFSTIRTCLDCADIRDGLTCGNGFLYGALWSDIREVSDQLTTACFNKITRASAKAYLVERWRQWKGLATK